MFSATMSDSTKAAQGREHTDVYAWMVNVVVAAEEAKYRENRQAVFLTDGIDLGQLQREVELRYSVAGRKAEIQEIKSLGAIGNSKM